MPTPRERLTPLYYHKVPDVVSHQIETLRKKYIALGMFLIDSLPDEPHNSGRSKALAITHLEESLMRAVQSLALQPSCEKIDPFDISINTPTSSATPVS